jgi:hypothetical protein
LFWMRTLYGGSKKAACARALCVNSA